MTDEPRKGKTIKSAFDSNTFATDVSIQVNEARVGQQVGSASISPSGRDVAIASYVQIPEISGS